MFYCVTYYISTILGFKYLTNLTFVSTFVNRFWQRYKPTIVTLLLFAFISDIDTYHQPHLSCTQNVLMCLWKLVIKNEALSCVFLWGCMSWERVREILSTFSQRSDVFFSLLILLRLWPCFYYAVGGTSNTAGQCVCDLHKHHSACLILGVALSVCGGSKGFVCAHWDSRTPQSYSQWRPCLVHVGSGVDDIPRPHISQCFNSHQQVLAFILGSSWDIGLCWTKWFCFSLVPYNLKKYK